MRREFGLKRRWLVAFGVLIIALSGVSYFYFLTFEPDRSRFPLRGIDVSQLQGSIDWARVARDDVAFAYLKATEGGDARDREFERNLAEARRVGLPVGAYHFFTFCAPADEQAANFIEVVPTGETDLPPVVDLEFQGNCARRPSTQEMTDEIAAFLEAVETHFERQAVFYVTDEFLNAYGDAIPERRIWIRSIIREPAEPGWAIWQYHPAGRVAGITGDVDLNVLPGPLDALLDP